MRGKAGILRICLAFGLMLLLVIAYLFYRDKLRGIKPIRDVAPE